MALQEDDISLKSPGDQFLSFLLLMVVLLVFSNFSMFFPVLRKLK